MTDIQHQSAGFFDTIDEPAHSLLPLQTSPSEPVPESLRRGTGLLSPDHATLHRLAHFDPDLYDLRPESHLVRFMRVMMGDAGSGQLRKRYLIARLQTVLSSTHFYDLDGFYGSLFGAQRKVEEHLPINPMDSTALPDEWDDIAIRDAKFRERISALARAIPMTGTLPGLQMAAEALTGVECDIYETWPLIDYYGGSALGRTYDDVESETTSWDQVEDFGSWDDVENRTLIGRSGLSSRHEVYVRPKRSYEPQGGISEREAARQRVEDELGILRVLNVLKPAGVLLTVDTDGMALHTSAAIASLRADSEFWQVLAKVQPRPIVCLDQNTSVYPVSSVLSSTGQVEPEGTLRALPLPPHTNTQGATWSYNGLITSANAYAMVDPTTAVTATGRVLNNRNWESVMVSGKAVSYGPSLGMTDQRALAAAQAASDNMLQSHCYSGPRVVVPTHG